MMNDFDKKIKEIKGESLKSISIETVQINIGRKCNQECEHCHLSASRISNEEMSLKTMEEVIDGIKKITPSKIEITGGAPELNRHFKAFIKELVKLHKEIIVRTNLTALCEKEMENLAEFYKKNEIHLIASLPCYEEENVRKQRGEGVYEKSIKVLKALNSIGYGKNLSLKLDLVYNPAGAFLPPSQRELEEDYRNELYKRHKIVFSNLLTITNMPIGRFWKTLRKEGREKEYLKFLRDSFNPLTIDNLMCLKQINIGWDGTVYDCDFNLALGLPINHGLSAHISTIDINSLIARRIVTGDHCFGCTAGTGSSCSGSLI
ncbi:MAG: radical SAM/Cys-rich domain protein [Candidatus Schekmanbacteria bacterium]|nr:MAG: radical SAM/Cys-rich domain protein [Candidatus Schekmanbacteria bacterium]